jgi:hypothetical protein
MDIARKGLQEGFKQWYACWQICVTAEGNYFKNCVVRPAMITGILIWANVHQLSDCECLMTMDWMSRVQSPARAKNFSSSLILPDWSFGPPSLLSNGHWGSPLVKSSQNVTMSTHSHPVTKSRMSRCYTFSTPATCFHSMYLGQLYFTALFKLALTVIFWVALMYNLVGSYQSSSEKLVTINKTKWRYKPEDCNQQLHHCKHFKSQIYLHSFFNLTCVGVKHEGKRLF